MKCFGTIFILMCCATTCIAQEFQHTTQPYKFESPSGDEIDSELGEFSVAENRGQENSRRIKLSYVKFPTTGESNGPPIVYLAGGPGGSGTGAASGARFDMFQQLRKLGDVVAFDQRGTGKSRRLPKSTHRWNVPRNEPATRESVSKAVAEAIEKSLADWESAGVDLGAYNTRESANDLEALRKVLGVEKLRLCGISYGTHLSLAYMRFFPESVHSVVLAGVEGPDHTVKLPADQQRLLEQIDLWIKEQPEAREAFPDFIGTVERVLMRLENEPVEIKSDGEVRYVITKFDVQRMTAAFLRGPQSFRMLPNLFKQMDDGKFATLPFVIGQMRSGGVSAMSMAMDAASGRTEARAELIQKQAAKTLLGDAINFPYELTRKLFDVPDLGDDFRSQLHSDIPVLAISGTADGRTPVTNAEEVLASLPNGSHLVINGAGHSDPLFLSSPEIVQTMLQFFAGEKMTDKRIKLDPIKFVLPR